MHAAMRGLVLATLLLAGGSGAAEDAGALLRKAFARFVGGEFADSATLLERARQLTVEPKLLGRILLQLGVCREVLGELDAARSAFRAALERDPEADLEPTRHRTSALELFRSVRDAAHGELVVVCEGGPGQVSLDGAPLEALPLTRQVRIGAHRVEVVGHDRAPVWSGKVVVPLGKRLAVRQRCPLLPPRLSVASDPPGAEVLLDGASIGRTPLDSVSVPAGRHRLLLRREGRRPLAVELELAAGTSKRIDRRLELLPPPPPPSRPAPSPRRRLWTWIVGGAAVASLAAALGTGLASRADHSEWEAERARRTDFQRWNDLRTSGERKQDAANALIGVGAALAAGAAVLFFLEGRPPRERALRTGAADLVVEF